MNTINGFFDSIIIGMFNFLHQNIKIELNAVSFNNLKHTDDKEKKKKILKIF